MNDWGRAQQMIADTTCALKSGPIYLSDTIRLIRVESVYSLNNIETLIKFMILADDNIPYTITAPIGDLIDCKGIKEMILKALGDEA